MGWLGKEQKVLCTYQGCESINFALSKRIFSKTKCPVSLKGRPYESIWHGLEHVLIFFLRNGCGHSCVMDNIKQDKIMVAIYERKSLMKDDSPIIVWLFLEPYNCFGPKMQ